LLCDYWSLNHSYREHTYANARTCSVLLAVPSSCGDRRHLQEFCVERCLLVSPLPHQPSRPRTHPPIFPYFIWNVETPAFLLALFIQKPLYHDSLVAPQIIARRMERLVTVGSV